MRLWLKLHQLTLPAFSIAWGLIVVAPLFLLGCTLDTTLESTRIPLNPILFIDTPNKLSVQNETGLVDLTLLADPLFYSEMYITNQKDCEAGGVWEPYSTIKARWPLENLTPVQNAIVYAKFRNAGRTKESSCISNSVFWAKANKMCDSVTNSSDPYGSLYDSGGSTGEYSDNESCTFSITSTSTIKLQFSELSIEYGDSLKIYDGDVATGTLLQIFDDHFANTAQLLTATSGRMTVHFSSDSTMAQAGFSAQWTSGSSALTQFKINNNTEYTSDPAVTLTLAPISNLPLMYVTNTAWCVAGGVWEQYQNTKSWNLDNSGNGMKNVYVKFKDAYDQETTCDKASIILDNAPPTSPLITLVTPFSDTTSSAQILFIPSIDEGTGVDHYEIRLTKVSDGTLVKDWTPARFSNEETSNLLFLDGLSLTVGEAYLPEIRAVDKIGLFSAAGTTTQAWTADSIVAVGFGDNSSGMLGLGNSDPRTPTLQAVEVYGGHKFTQIVVGTEHSCGLESVTQNAYCWGSGARGRLGTNSTKDSLIPNLVLGVSGGQPLRFTQITAGESHTCAIEEATQNAYCWGDNGQIIGESGRLGNNSSELSLTPTAVLGINGSAPMKFSKITAGRTHTCAIEVGTELAYCWGSGLNGRLGNNSVTNSLTPTPVSGPSSGASLKFAEISAGSSHTCGIESSSKKAYCWGSNTYGRLGNNSTVESYTPVAVVGIGGGAAMDFSQISAGPSHTCGIEALTQKAYCWGGNGNGRLGDGTYNQSLVPVAVVGVGGGATMNIVQIISGISHTCAIEATTQVAYCWGYNLYGQLANGSISVTNTPVAVSSLMGPINFVQVAAGDSHSCAIEATTQKAYCWGRGANGRLGNNGTTQILSPTAIGLNGGPRLNFVSITGGASHTCSIQSVTKNAYCWGQNTYGQLGDNTTEPKTLPTLVLGVGGGAPLLHFKISAGTSHTCSIESGTSKAYCWGNGANGRLGNNATTNRLTPVAVSGISGSTTTINFGNIVAGASHTCATETITQKVYCWGSNSNGQLGNNSTVDSPIPVAVLGVNGGPALSFSKISVGNAFTCGIETGTKKAYCWGSNSNGSLGNNSLVDSPTPVAVSGVGGGSSLNFFDISLGDSHACAIEDITRLGYCWGNGSNGRLGNNSTSVSLTPAPVANATDGTALTFASISAGLSHSCGIHMTKKAYCWGANQYGQLGLNTVLESSAPSPIPIMIFRYIETAENFTLGITF